jgi:hypothetical protein
MKMKNNSKTSMPLAMSYKEHQRLLKLKVSTVGLEGKTINEAARLGELVIEAEAQRNEKGLHINIDNLHTMFKKIKNMDSEENIILVQKFFDQTVDLRSECLIFGYQFLAEILYGVVELLEFANYKTEKVTSKIIEAIGLHIHFLGLSSDSYDRNKLTDNHYKVLNQLREMNNKIT